MSGGQSWGKALAAGFIGYTAACFSGAAAMTACAQISNPDLSNLSAFPVITLVVAILSLPGFLVLRGLLFALSAQSHPAFVLCGAFNGLAAAAWLASSSSHGWGPSNFVMMAVFALSGAVSGFVYRKVERSLLHMALVAE